MQDSEISVVFVEDDAVQSPFTSQCAFLDRTCDNRCSALAEPRADERKFCGIFSPCSGSWQTTNVDLEEPQLVSFYCFSLEVCLSDGVRASTEQGRREKTAEWKSRRRDFGRSVAQLHLREWLKTIDRDSSRRVHTYSLLLSACVDVRFLRSCKSRTC